jgi:hypothetical protein
MADTTPLEVITFVPWVDPLVDPYRIDPTGHYSRLAWLPLLGPTSWVLIGTIAQHLDIEPEVTWQLQDLARDHGLGRPGRPSFVLRRSLQRLERFGLLRFEGAPVARVRTNMPPLTPRQIARSPRHVRQLHELSYPHRQRRQA